MIGVQQTSTQCLLSPQPVPIPSGRAVVLSHQISVSGAIVIQAGFGIEFPASVAEAVQDRARGGD